MTIHYRLAVAERDGWREVFSTFDARPATLQLGAGQLAAPLEQRLLGLDEGVEAQFEVPAGEAYGRRNPELVQRLSRKLFDANTEPDADYAPGDVVRLALADGVQMGGVLKDADDEHVVVDFNHPLAGLPVQFAVRVIGVL
ncbi:MAG: peptidylprolyl isomerase [Betaproteobacteria bacterium]